jgi:hypothetical protein
LLDLCRKVDFGGKQVHDACIVATMMAHGGRRLLTFSSSDFERSRKLSICSRLERTPPVLAVGRLACPDEANPAPSWRPAEPKGKARARGRSGAVSI